MISETAFAARSAIAAAMMMLVATLAQAQGSNSASNLYETCNALAEAPEDLSDLNGQELINAVLCGAYVDAVHAALYRIHAYLKGTLRDYGNFKDEVFVKGWIASQALLAPDVCFPETIKPKILAMIISKYGKEHPEQLSDDSFWFAARAFVEAYPLTRSESCLH